MARKLSMEPDQLRNYIFQNVGKKTVYEMHLETDINANTIRDYAYDMGLSIEVEEKKNRRERLTEAIVLNHETKTAAEIAKEVGCPRATVYYRAWKMGINLRAEDNPVPSVINVKVSRQKFFNERLRENWLI